MLRINFIGEIENIISYKEEEIQGKNGPFTAYTLLFVMKSKRSYKVNGVPYYDTINCILHGQSAKHIKSFYPKCKYIDGCGELTLMKDTLVLTINTIYTTKEEIPMSLEKSSYIELN